VYCYILYALVGTAFSVVVNGASASETLQSISKPNFVEVDLTGAAPTA